MREDWPQLGAERDGPTIAFLHLISQVVGKVPTALLPWRNHGWHLTLHVTARGLATELIHAGGRSFELTIDLVEHQLTFADALVAPGRIPLDGRSVAAIRRELLAMLDAAGLPTDYHPMPNEIEGAIPFDQDEAPRAYDQDSARRLHRALLSVDRVLRHFRSSFLGKVSPVHFFWGSFDLAVTRFSGRLAPPHPGGIPHLPDAVTREAYSHEVSSAGFWPGGAGAPGEPFFYSYAYPAPDGFRQSAVTPPGARFDTKLGEFVLDYETVRAAQDPDAALLTFLQSSYEAAAGTGDWDRTALECEPGALGRPRPV